MGFLFNQLKRMNRISLDLAKKSLERTYYQHSRMEKRYGMVK